VFAYVGRPDDLSKGPFPGVVLVHGGGGRAFEDWADHWAARGYVAIAMDTAGNGPGKQRLKDGGPDQQDTVKFKNFDASSVRDMWTYHAVADVILAHSLLRSLPEVDAERTALTGISWGGYLTCLTSGIDQRFKASVPVYGCGFLHDNSVWEDNGSFGRLNAASRRNWVRYFDPGQHVGRVSFPMLFFNGTNDFAYPLDSYRKTIEQVKPELANVAIHHRLKHGHYWEFPIVDRFIDSFLREEAPLVRLGEIRFVDGMARAEVLNDGSVNEVALWYTDDRGPWQKREWARADGRVGQGFIAAEVPEVRPVALYLEATDARGLRTTTAPVDRWTAHMEKAAVPTPKLEQDFYDWHRRHAEVLRIKDEVDPEIVLIGDSITHMWGGRPEEPGRAYGDESWTALFGDRALNLGFGWDRTQNVLWRIDHGQLDGLNPKLVVVHIGTNNLASTANHEAGTPKEIAEGIRAVLERIRGKLPQSPLVLMAVFPRGETPNHPMRAPIAEINRLLPAIAEACDAHWLDLTEALLEEDGTFPRRLASDFLHPSAEGYAIWAEALQPFLP
jgi:dienelactone hydrolase/lysophospholipase L1-like esterase